MPNVLDSLTSNLSLKLGVNDVPEPRFNNDPESAEYKKSLEKSVLDKDGQDPDKYADNAPDGARFAS